MTQTNSTFVTMEELNKEIMFHADLYFNKNTSIISDQEYDDKVEQFNKLKQDNPELAELFAFNDKPVPIHEPSNSGLNTIKFDTPMLSLKKALDLNSLQLFTNKFPDTEFYDEWKLDGLALSLNYNKKEDGYLHLDSIYTRGDGLEGEDVSHTILLFNIKGFKTKLKIKKDIPDKLEIRGEAYLPIYNFNAYNEAAIKKKSNPRNAVSGFIRSLEENLDKEALRLVHFNVYWSDYTFGCETYEELRHKWVELGLEPPPEAPVGSLDDYDYLDSLFATIPVDGMVRKVNSLAKQMELGVTNQYPNYAIAYKFPNEEQETTPISMDWQVGKTGRVTPCINYHNVNFRGVNCDRASLDNYYQFLALELREDSVISVSRNGDVIPRVNKVIYHGTGKLFKAPTECPSCNSVLEVRKGKYSAELICTNVVECPAQLLMRCVAMTGKRCLDIDGLGPVMLSRLISNEVIVETSDILHLDTYPLLPGKIAVQIKDARKQPWYVIIKALGLPGIETTRAKKIADALPAEFYNGKVVPTELLPFLKNHAKLMEIPGMGPGLVMGIVRTLSNKDFYDNARNILKYMTPIINNTPVMLIKGVITGTLGQSRETLVDYFGEHGIELVDNLTKDCQFLLLGEKPSKSKELKATELSIPMFTGNKASSIDHLIKMIKELTK